MIAAVIFLVVVIVLMVHRHFFDDETINAYLITHYSLGELYHFAQSQDVHPPFGYLANGIVYQLFGSLNAILWCNALTLAVMIFGFVYALAPKADSPLKLGALVVATALNPSLLIWGVSLRWYAYWTPLAVALFLVLFQFKRSPRTLPIAGALAVACFYFGYLALVYVAVLIATEWLIHGVRFSRRLLVTAGVCCATILPQCYYLVTVHIPQGKGQSSHNPKDVLGAAGVGTFLGPTLFPVDKIAIAFTILAGGMTTWVLVKRLSGSFRKNLRALDPLILVAILLFGAEVVTGISVKERNLILANVFLFGWLSVNLDVLPKVARYGFAVATLGFLGISTRNAVLQTNTGKASINMPIAQLRDHIREDELAAGVDDSRAWLITYDDIASCYGLLWKMNLAGPFSKGVEHEAANYDYHIPAGTFIVSLKTQQGGWEGIGLASSHRFWSQAVDAIKNPHFAKFGRDPHHGFETAMTRHDFPEFQIEYVSGITSKPVDLHWQSVP